MHENKVRNYAFISPIIPYLVDVNRLIDEPRDFVDYYWLEFLNLRSSGSTFKKWLKNSYPESYRLLTDKSEVFKYARDIIDALKGNIPIKGVVLHYPRMINLKVD